MREAISVCRVCSGFCGLTVTVDDDGRAVKVRGDRRHPVSRGFACSKGLDIPDQTNRPDRVLRPLKRLEDGRFVELPLSDALDEIAERLNAILDEDGGRAVATFSGTNHWHNNPVSYLHEAFLAALGSPNKYTTGTIDQSAHLVTMGRMGIWAPGRRPFEDCDVSLMLGSNPLVSLGAYMAISVDPVKRLKEAKARGMKLIVIDPRRSETAAHADLFLQPMPGHDAAILAALIRIILANGWHDAEFCDRYVEGLEAMRAAVAPFTAEAVAARAGIAAEQLEQAAAMFARDNRRGHAIVGTGGTMAPHSNLIDHLIETLTVICGRFLREGDRIPNIGVFSPPAPVHAEVIPIGRMWETSPQTTTGYGQLFGEFPSTMLPDEILTDAPGRIRALFVNGANPAACLPDQRKAVRALAALDLLVSIEPNMSATARLCSYIIPPLLQLEREDVLFGPRTERLLGHIPFAQWIPAAVQPPTGAELIDDWQLYWALAERLGLQLTVGPHVLLPAGEDRTGPVAMPTTEALLETILAGSRVPFATVRNAPLGVMCEDEAFIAPPRPEATARFTLAPADVLDEIATVASEDLDAEGAGYSHRLTVRRERAMMNSLEPWRPGENRPRGAPAYFHPEDIALLGLGEDDEIEIVSETGRLRAAVRTDAALRRGVVSISQCRGPLPGEDESVGSTSLLVRTDRDIETINAMPRFTAIPVNVTRLGAA
jgi:anaerobic selenocysteine-containing dehydrogenase